jgi:GT2 family glycosyltransferase
MKNISIILPAYNAGRHLTASLAAIDKLDPPPQEVIVVDDGSTDGSLEAAASRGYTVLSTHGRKGPAEARNIGAQAAKGEILFFLDSDVCPPPDALERVSAALADPDVAAVIGSYDADPAEPDFLSQYRNLMHCFVHQTGETEASTFWSGCGAIRRSVFLEMSGFDVSYKRPAIEDIELGYRLKNAGHRIVLDRELVVKHLKKWTFWGLVKTDVLDRGIPWTELILRDNNMPNDLNLRISQRISVALVYLLLGFAAFFAVRFGAYFLIPLFAIVFALLSRYWGDGAARSRIVGAVMVATAAAIGMLAWRFHMLTLIPLLIAAVPLLFLRHRYHESRGWRLLHAAYLVGTTVAALLYLPSSVALLGLIGGTLLVATLNNRFYIFLAQKRGRAFAIAAFPFHLLYHLYNGFSFAAGMCRWWFRRLFERQGAEVAWRGSGPRS